MNGPGPLTTLRDRIAGGELTAEAAVRAALDAIARHDPALHAFTAVTVEGALDNARAVDHARTRGERLGPLAGVPIAIKDNICTRTLPTTAASAVLRGFRPPYDATVVSRLAAAGAVVVGKTNCDEFAMGSSTENSAYGPTRNPVGARSHARRIERRIGRGRGPRHGAGGARLRYRRLDPPAGGVLRRGRAQAHLRPGLALRPARLRVVTRSDRALHHDGRRRRPGAGGDRRWRPARRDLRHPSGARLGGRARPAASPACASGSRAASYRTGVDAAVLQAFEAALAAWRDAGATIVDVELPNAPLAIPVYYLIATAEASSNLARYDGVRYGYRTRLTPADGLREMYERTRDEGFGAEVKRRIILGTFVLSAGYHDAYYVKAQLVRAKVRDDYTRAFANRRRRRHADDADPAFRLGEKTADPLQMYLADIFTVSANLAGLPAISLPCGVDADGLPIGCQLTARRWEEDTLLAAGAALQARTDWHRRRPPDHEQIRQIRDYRVIA